MVFWRWVRRVSGAFFICAGLSGCGVPTGPVDPPDPDLRAPAIVAGCCTQAERYPDWMVDLATANSDLVREIGKVQLRSGRLADQDEALDLVLDTLRPLDVVLLQSPNRVSNLLIPGRFTHGAMYLGTEAELRAAGLWHLSALDPVREQIADGEVFLEAVDVGVRTEHPDVVLDTDGVVLLRPDISDPDAALERALSYLGTPFDMAFDASDTEAVFCAQLLALTFPGLGIRQSEVYGRTTILLDRIIADALSGDVAMRYIGYLEASARGGVRVLSQEDLAWRLREAWPNDQP